MGSNSADVIVAVGVDIKDAFNIQTVKLKRPQYDTETGAQSMIDYDQVYIRAFGREIERGDKLVNERNPELGFSMGTPVYNWFLRNGFDTDECYTLWHTDNGYFSFEGVVGLPVFQSSHTHEIDLKAVFEVEEKVKPLLQAVGCKMEPKLYVRPRLH